jgi:hypothetical protein
MKNVTINIQKNQQGLIHSEQSPAYYSKNPNNGLEYYEWWNNGHIVGILSSQNFRYSPTGRVQDLIIKPFNSDWIGKEKNITPQDIVLFYSSQQEFRHTSTQEESNQFIQQKLESVENQSTKTKTTKPRKAKVKKTTTSV